MTRKPTAQWDYLAPAYRDHADAADFEARLKDRCDWTSDDFSGDYAWDSPIPAREDWDAEIDKFNQHLATL